MDGQGQIGSADDTGNGTSHNGSAHEALTGNTLAGWESRSDAWSSAGSALEPGFDNFRTWEPAIPDRRGIDALGGQDPLTTTMTRRPYFSESAEDPYADELAQRSAEFARHAALDGPTPPTGLPQLTAVPPGLQPKLPPELSEPVEQGQPEADTPLASAAEAATSSWTEHSRLSSLGERFGQAFSPPNQSALSRFGALPGEEAQADPYADDPLDTFRPLASVTELKPLSPAQPAAAQEDEAESDEDADDLPQRIPSAPDVPPAYHPLDQALDADSVPAGDPELRQIASHLRQQPDIPAEERPDGFDVEAVLRAVRAVAGVRDANLRTTPQGAHHLRLDLAEGADPAAISRMVARMLSDQMGLNAAPATEAQAAAAAAQTPEPLHPAATLPSPRSGVGAEPPPASLPHGPFGTSEPLSDLPPREPRRRHPVGVPRRSPADLRFGDRTPGRNLGEGELPSAASPPPLANSRDQGPRPIIEHVQTSTFGLDATVEVRLNNGDRTASGVASGPAVDAYVLRLCAAATAAAIDDLLREGTTTGEVGRCFVEQAALVPMGSCDVAVVVVLLVCGGWVEQLAGSALVSGDPRRAVVRATLGAVNRRLAALLP